LSKAGSIDLLGLVQEKKQKKDGPFVMVFLGINGTGKTTTVAKVANLLKRNGFSVVIAAADTHRAGAIEQITKHAENLSIKIISQRYGADPSAVSRDALEYAKKHYIDTVLIDTAGRMQTAKNLMYEIGKIVKVIKPDIKLFIGDSLAGNDTINQAREFFSYTEFDGAILTKSDADAKGGAAISISYITSKPIVYLGMGQGYDDLILFDNEKFIDAIFNNGALSNSGDIPLPSNPEIEKNSNSFDNSKVKTTKSISRSNVVNGINADKTNMDSITADNNKKNEQKNIVESADIIPELDSQIDIEEFDNSYHDVSSKPTIQEHDNPSDDDNKLEVEDKIKTNVDSDSELRGKKGLFGWFKRKK
jgi:fused signal recognition particle receptor